MKKTLQSAALGTALLCTSQIALAVDIGGLEVPTGSLFSVVQLYENVPTNIGDELTGYGKVDSIGSEAIGDLCSGCELTYEFGGYTVAQVSATEIRFTGGFVNFYLGFDADKDFTTSNAGGSAGDLAEATNGTLFLSLKGHAIDAAGNTFIGTGADIGTATPTGFGTGLLDVDTSAGGIANAFFDTNSIVAAFGGAADFGLGSSFSALNPVYPGECPGGAACLRGSIDVTGSVVPLPPALALMLAATGALGALGRRRKV